MRRGRGVSRPRCAGGAASPHPAPNLPPCRCSPARDGLREIVPSASGRTQGPKSPAARQFCLPGRPSIRVLRELDGIAPGPKLLLEAGRELALRGDIERPAVLPSANWCSRCGGNGWSIRPSASTAYLTSAPPLSRRGCRRRAVCSLQGSPSRTNPPHS